MKTAYYTSPGLFANLLPAGHHRDGGGHKGPQYHEYCSDCCRPAHACCCGSRRCRKEAKELLVEGKSGNLRELAGTTEFATARQVLSTVHFMRGTDVVGDQTPAKATRVKTATRASESVSLVETDTATVGIASAFIGGGCCVHLSIEYMPDKPLAPATGAVAVVVADNDKTVMMWAKIVDADDGYRIQEDIITTHPGAKLTVVVSNVTARVRWCEVFSC